MASISGALHLLRTGDNVVCIADAYGGTLRYINSIITPTYGITATYGDFTTDNIVELLASQPKTTKMIWLESPSNPLLKVLDIQEISKAMHTVFNNQCLLVVDNTFMSPYFQRPLELGADLVVESATKFLNGHSDVVGGVVVGRNAVLEKKLRHTQNALGAVPSPFDCYLTLRGIKTLPLRMERSASNAMKIATFLEQHVCVEKCLYVSVVVVVVFCCCCCCCCCECCCCESICFSLHLVILTTICFRLLLLFWICCTCICSFVRVSVQPGLNSHPQHALCAKQMLNNGYGSMIVFYCIGGFDHAKRLLEGFRLWTLAESLGAVESLVESPAIMTHASIPKEKREELGIHDNLIRLSVGVENVEDLIDDLAQALAPLNEM